MKSKLQKRKEREREVRKKILHRRESKLAREKENAKFDAEEKAVRNKQHPIRNEEWYATQRLRDTQIRIELEHNMELLDGLQKEYAEANDGDSLVEKATSHLQKVYEKDHS